MKKILIIATILTANIFAFDSVTYFGGVNAEGELTIKSPTSKDKQSQEYKLVAGMELNKELKAHKNIELGLGIRYEEDFEARSINYDDHFAATIPVYAMAKYKFVLDRTSNMYVKANIGYNFVIEGDYIEDIKNAYLEKNGKLVIILPDGYMIKIDKECDNYEKFCLDLKDKEIIDQ